MRLRFTIKATNIITSPTTPKPSNITVRQQRKETQMLSCSWDIAMKPAKGLQKTPQRLLNGIVKLLSKETESRNPICQTVTKTG